MVFFNVSIAILYGSQVNPMTLGPPLKILFSSPVLSIVAMRTAVKPRLITTIARILSLSIKLVALFPKWFDGTDTLKCGQNSSIKTCEPTNGYPPPSKLAVRLVQKSKGELKS